MFDNNRLLKPEECGDLAVTDTQDWSFAAQEMLVPMVFMEMADIAREYPLVFVIGKPMLYALMGVESGVNAYVSREGRWLASYIPLRLSAYPLGLTSVPDKPGDFALVLDQDAPQVVQGVTNGNPLFINGKPSPFLKGRISQLEAMQKAEPMTRRMVEVIREAGLLRDRDIMISKKGGSQSKLSGMQVIDENKLNAMPHEAFAALRDQGVLPLIYAHLLSMANLRQGAIAGRYPELARGRAGQVAEGLFSADGVLNFDFLRGDGGQDRH